MNMRKLIPLSRLLVVYGGMTLCLSVGPGIRAQQAGPVTPEDLLRLRAVTAADISPRGEWVAITVSIPREGTDSAGSAYSELSLVSTLTGEVRQFVSGTVTARSPAWRPDGAGVAFLSKRENNKQTQVWYIPADGGEAKQLTSSATRVLSFKWDPSGNRLAYIAESPPTPRERELKKRGYDFIFYEEDWKHRNLYLLPVTGDGRPGTAEQVTAGKSVWDMEFSPDGATLAVAVTDRNLVDDNYMFRRIEILSPGTRSTAVLVRRPWKLGNLVFSPDGSRLAYAAALDSSDNQVSQAYVVSLKGGVPRNLTPPDFRGHVTWVGWSDKATVLARTEEGVTTTLSRIPAAGGARTVQLSSEKEGFVFDTPSFSADGSRMALVGSSPTVPPEVFVWLKGRGPRRLTTVNPWLQDRTLGEQSVIRYSARDGMEIEGLLISPPGAGTGERYPLLVIVHGGPESNYSNGWLTRYSEPGQVFAGKGYRVFYPNYRASTGYGVAFARAGLGDPAGKEFDDVADGIQHLIRAGLADSARVGLGGGSYGGYASAWFATYYTRMVRAVCMFVGVSNLISRLGTTDIPYEEMYVHSGWALEDKWDFSLQRSPVYWAHQSRTATLIVGGAADTRVHPSQSMELYRRMKMTDHPAVRLVQYPGEGHGNSKQPARIDLLLRMLDWYDWYVRDLKPLTGPLPPLDISDRYGLTLPERTTSP